MNDLGSELKRAAKLIGYNGEIGEGAEGIGGTLSAFLGRDGDQYDIFNDKVLANMLRRANQHSERLLKKVLYDLRYPPPPGYSRMVVMTNNEEAGS